MYSPLLRTLFLHHDGIVLGATVAALSRPGLLARLWREKRLSLGEISAGFPANAGYLHVALRSLALQGWLRRHGKPATDALIFEVTAAGEIAAEAFATYAEVGEFIYSGVPAEEYLFGHANESYTRLASWCGQGWGLPTGRGDTGRQTLFETVRQHLDGLLVGPLMIALERRGLLEGDYFPVELPLARENLKVALELLRYMGWIEPQDSRWRFTELGRVACNFSLHYGLTLSYWPLFCKLPQLIFGPGKNVTHRELGQEETHVDRTLNVLASGTAHGRYFEDSDAVILQIFNQEPLRAQPGFVADMGCGDGTWLQRIFEVVRDRTLRGKHLGEYPLLMVGADFNAKALEVAQLRLRAAGVPSLTLFGDVTDPDQFAASLRGHGLDCQDGLHVRAFIDHNRHYAPPHDRERAQQRDCLSSGAYADPDGTAIPNQLLEQNLVEHFQKWAPYVHRHGLIVIEAHSVDPAIAAKYSGRCHAGAFDTYHGYSNQYPVDFEAFMALAEEAGLRSVLYQQRVYPLRLPFVAISLNRFRTADPTCLDRLARAGRPIGRGWQPDDATDPVDGDALHRLLYRDGDITRPASWCFAATRVLVVAVLEALERRITQCLAGNDGRRSITLLDYGAGTGLATVEVIKALDEKGLLNQMKRLGIDFKILLFDLPSSWFAKAYDLLGQLEFVQFHSLRNPASGKIRLVTELLDGESVDIIVASMVLHLIPARVMPALFDSFAAALKADGSFIWNSPDTTPTMSDAEVVHVANRVLRGAISDVLDGNIRLDTLLATMPAEERAGYAGLLLALAQMQNELTPQRRAAAKAFGELQILPVPTNVSVIHSALSRHFAGEVSNLVSLMREDELLELALLPANQRYYSEIEDPHWRALLTRLLMKYKVLPELRAGRAGHPAGINLQWTYGLHVKRG